MRQGKLHKESREMNPFDALLADFAQKTGLEFGGPGTDSLDLEADGVAV